MHNWYGIETEAEFRRQEWQRAIAAESRAALARTGDVASRGWRLPHPSVAPLRRLGAWRAPFGAPRRPAVFAPK